VIDVENMSDLWSDKVRLDSHILLNYIYLGDVPSKSWSKLVKYLTVKKYIPNFVGPKVRQGGQNGTQRSDKSRLMYPLL
jgi:hypothetical protein